MEILSNVSISLKDICLLIAGGIIGSIPSYFVGLIVAAQTDKRRNLIVELLRREIILEQGNYYPFKIQENETEEILNNCYKICVRIWNKGKTEIRHDDISKENPLKIYLDTTARIIGKPQIFFENDNIDFDIQKVAKNCYQIDFECINPREWIQANFYITGNPYTKVTAQGRIFGQETQFDTTTDDTIATLYERVSSLLAALFLTSTPLMLIVGLIWYFISGYSLSQLIQEQDSIPYFLLLFLYGGIGGTFIFIFAFVLPSIKRRQVPKNYPIEEDFKPNPLQFIRIYWITAITQKTVWSI